MGDLIAVYIPHWERAIGPALIQLVLIGVLAAALFRYLQQYYGRGPTLVVLLLSEVAAVGGALAMEISQGLGEYGGACRLMLGADYSDGFLSIVMFFELYRFAIVSFVALIVGAVVLVIGGVTTLLVTRTLTWFTVQGKTDSSS